MIPWRTLAAAFGMVMALGACTAQSPAAQPAPSGSAALGEPTNSASNSDPDATQTASDTAAPGPGKTSTGTATGGTPESVPSSDRNSAPLAVELSRPCIDRGEEMLVTAVSEPRSGIGFAVGYTEPPEGQPKIVPDFTYFDRESNPTGTVKWTFVIRPDIPYGPALLKTVASTPDGRGAVRENRFEVSPSC